MVLERNRELGYDRDEQNDIVLRLERNLLLLSKVQSVRYNCIKRVMGGNWNGKAGRVGLRMRLIRYSPFDLVTK